MDNQRYQELKETIRLYSKLQQDYDKNVSIARVVESRHEGEHETQQLGIHMVSKKNMHWTNTMSGKAPLQVRQDEAPPSDAKEEKKEKPKKPGKEAKA